MCIDSLLLFSTYADPAIFSKGGGGLRNAHISFGFLDIFEQIREMCSINFFILNTFMEHPLFLCRTCTLLYHKMWSTQLTTECEAEAKVLAIIKFKIIHIG